MFYDYNPDNNSQSAGKGVVSTNIKVDCKVSLKFTSNASWEQAITIYIGNARHSTQLGTYERENYVTLDVKNGDALTLCGWHKKGTAHHGSVPWSPSAGTKDGEITGVQVVFRWEDSSTGNDFNDSVVTLFISGGSSEKSAYTTQKANMVIANGRMVSESKSFHINSTATTISVGLESGAKSAFIEGLGFAQFCGAGSVTLPSGGDFTLKVGEICPQPGKLPSVTVTYHT